jgi:hypothetical protein
MKKQLLILSVFALGGLNYVFGQACTPDPQYTTPGIYPDSATGLPKGQVNVLYSVTVTAVVPKDTVASFGGFPPQNVTIDRIKIKDTDNDGIAVSGLPAGFSYFCNPSNCEFPGNSKGCILITGTSSTALDSTLRVELAADVTHPTFGSVNDIPQETVDYYHIIIEDPNSVAQIIDTREGLILMNNNPNPFTDKTFISFYATEKSAVTIQVYNMIGETVSTEVISPSKGLNRKEFNAANLPAGVYMYSVSQDNKIKVGRMVLSSN